MYSFLFSYSNNSTSAARISSYLVKIKILFYSISNFIDFDPALCWPLIMYGCYITLITSSFLYNPLSTTLSFLIVLAPPISTIFFTSLSFSSTRSCNRPISLTFSCLIFFISLRYNSSVRTVFLTFNINYST